MLVRKDESVLWSGGEASLSLFISHARINSRGEWGGVVVGIKRERRRRKRNPS